MNVMFYFLPCCYVIIIESILSKLFIIKFSSIKLTLGSSLLKKAVIFSKVPSGLLTLNAILVLRTTLSNMLILLVLAKSKSLINFE